MAAVVVGLGAVGVVEVVEMSVGSGFAVEGTSVRKRVHVDVGSEVAGEPFLQDNRMMAGQSGRYSVAGVPSLLLPKAAMVDQKRTAMVLDAGFVEAAEVQAVSDESLVAL